MKKLWVKYNYDLYLRCFKLRLQFRLVRLLIPKKDREWYKDNLEKLHCSITDTQYPYSDKVKEELKYIQCLGVLLERL